MSLTMPRARWLLEADDVNNARPLPLFARDAPDTDSAKEVGLFVPVEEVFPDTETSERALVQVLATLSRDDTLFQCARINTLVSGFGDFDNKPRQEQALAMLCAPQHIDRINDFARRHRTSGLPAIFFRGQLLELMRWAARHCENLSGDSRTYEEPAFRERFAKAALIAGGLWGKRTFRDRLSADVDVAEVRLRALGALHYAEEWKRPILRPTLAWRSAAAGSCLPSISPVTTPASQNCSRAQRA